jgi:hypothetical protein
LEAYRFVRTATGQQSDIRTLPVNQVTLSVEKGGSSTKSKAA